MANNDTYYAAGPMQAGLASQAVGLAWFALALIALPLIALLVIVGLIYEGVIRIDRRQLLPSSVHWAASAGLGIVLVAGVTALVLSRL